MATSVLVQAQLEDQEGNAKIQNTYASAFTRFYNFMSSIIQGHNMSSMYETARELGLQSFISVQLAFVSDFTGLPRAPWAV